MTVHKRFDNSIRVGYSKTEKVDDPNDLEHPSVREALKLLEIGGGIEITTMADIPSGGTGLGSSSSFLVGLLNALHAWKGEYATPAELAEESVRIEREILKEPGGKQDQYMAALGGLQLLEFKKDETVVPTPIIMSEDSREKLQKHLLLLYTGIQRRSALIHTKQTAEVGKHVAVYDKMVKITYEMFGDLTKNRWAMTGKYLHENWILKKTLSNAITDGKIDGYYERALAHGAEGGKLVGAGGGGFLMFFAKPEMQNSIMEALPELRPEPFEFAYFGSRIIYVGD